MLNTKQQLISLNINTTSAARAIQDVNQIIDTSNKPKITTIVNLINDIGIEFTEDQIKPIGKSNTESTAIMMIHGLIEYIIANNHRIDKNNAIEYSIQRVTNLINKPNNQWWFATNQTNYQNNNIQSTITVNNETVEIKTNGKIKKGGKQILAADLYKKFYADKKANNQQPDKSDRKALIALFIKHLDMQSAGASTYVYNMQKQFGIPSN